MKSGLLTVATIVLSMTSLYAEDSDWSTRINELQVSDLVAERTTLEQRNEFLSTTRNKKILEALQSEPDEDTWPGAFWNAGIINEKGPVVEEALEKGFSQFNDLSSRMQQVVLRSAHTLYPGQFKYRILPLLPAISDDKTFAIGAYDILNADSSIQAREALKSILEERFPGWESMPRLKVLHRRLQMSPDEMIKNRPPLKDLISADFTEGYPLVISFQRLDRNFPGLVVVRNSSGKFVRHSDGSLFQVPQLALSKTNMPGTITYGNSPQGIYTIVDAGLATNMFIGPTPYLYSKVPFEASVEEFLHSSKVDEEKPWSIDLYRDLLPESWQDYFPFYEAWYAGEAGRTEMIIHGTTINPEFYRGESYYPHTPSAGCLCAKEFWSEEDGSLIYSDQLSLLRAYNESGKIKGYLLLVELDNQQKPVTMDDVISELLAVEADSAEN